MSAATFEQWCLVELFGHQQVVGLVSEQTIGGQAFIRVDVPAVKRGRALHEALRPGCDLLPDADRRGPSVQSMRRTHERCRQA